MVATAVYNAPKTPPYPPFSVPRHSYSYNVWKKWTTPKEKCSNHVCVNELIVLDEKYRFQSRIISTKKICLHALTIHKYIQSTLFMRYIIVIKKIHVCMYIFTLSMYVSWRRYRSTDSGSKWINYRSSSRTFTTQNWQENE